MTEDMQTSWRYLNPASSRFSTVKSYLKRNISSETQALSWKEWAAQKIKLRRGAGGGEDLCMEKVTLFPGWATRRYGDVVGNETFGIDVFVSGFATSDRSTEQATRSQRAFIRLAKSFVSLPKLAADVIAPHSVSEPPTPLRVSTSTESLLAHIKLSPRTTEIQANYDIEALELEFQRVDTAHDDEYTPNPGPSRVSSTGDYPGARGHENGSVNRHPPNSHARAAADVLRRQHANLERRLQPFWSSALPARTVRLHVFASPHLPTSPSSSEAQQPNNSAHSPVYSQDVVTAADGSFQALFRMKWDDLCQHPGALHITFGDKLEEHELLLTAELLPPTISASSSVVSMQPQSHPHFIYPRHDQIPRPNVSALQVSLTHSPIRVISDIDDTIKLSNILLGARAVFHSVFVKDLHENIIPGMGEWYTDMWSKGVRFHYVSNGPFQILPVINEFFQISQLPPGSIRLKSYAGRSLFTGILSAPATRKRAGVVDTLESFPDSRFFLIGDSGEQDLELYADLAREHPHQILAVLIRDVDATCEPVEDPTGWKNIGAAGTRSDPLLSMSRSNTDDRARPRRALSDLLGRAPPSSFTGKRLFPANDSPGAARNGGPSGGVDYFAPMRFTTEPESEFESDTTPSSTPSISPRALSQSSDCSATPKLKIKVKPINTSAPTPVPPMSPYAYGYGSHLAPLPSPAPSLGSRSSGSSASRISMSLSLPGLSDADRKRNGLQLRAYRARTQMPGHVPLRVFRNPKECVEVEEVLKSVEQ